MSMTARERMMAVLSGEEPDKIPVYTYAGLRTGSQGGWMRRLMKRGMGVIHFAPPHKPAFLHPLWINPHLEDVKYIQIHYREKGVLKYRQTFETPVGSVTGVVMVNPQPVQFMLDAQQEYLVKDPADWRVVNYIFQGILNNLAPNYEAFEREEDELGDQGISFGLIGKTPYQRAWVELASPERAVIDFHEQPEELQEYIEIQKRLHTRIAEIAAESPAKFIDIADNITDMISPTYYREYCMPIYEIYHKLLEGTGKVLGTHMDGRIGNLKKEVAEAAFKIIESYTVPPAGDISLTEAKAIWPDKTIFMNTAPHLAWAEPQEVRKGYEALAQEWGSKRGLLLENSEELPLEKVEAHISAAMDAFGY